MPKQAEAPILVAEQTLAAIGFSGDAAAADHHSTVAAHSRSIVVVASQQQLVFPSSPTLSSSSSSRSIAFVSLSAASLIFFPATIPAMLGPTAIC
ncbi:unnamed protein product [Sphagnum troendelagicum]|uniref:Uncharacterized protein n=1 Tax=Sphagnum jensenii TaxID=128206 RepID=A0ABP0W4Y2_9BRYO